METDNQEMIHIPIDGTLEIYEVQIIHGKGKGILRRTVHSLLEKHPEVLSYKIDSGPSSWGATIVQLKH